MELLGAAAISVVVIAALAIRRHWDRRRVVSTVLIYGMSLWISLVMITFGIETIRRPASVWVLGVVMLIVGIVGGTLMVRALAREPAGAAPSVESGELSGPWFDYIVWSMLVVPMLIAGALVVFVVLGVR
jgi:hypothetical protein